jgi:hypothetical protein
MGHKGQLARSRHMTTPDAHGNYDLGKNYCYHRVVDENDVVDYQGPNEAIINEQFLKPAAPIFAGAGANGRAPSHKMIVTGIACGGHHMLVTARAPGEAASRLYSCGLNNYGQLGLGDVNDASAEVSADRHELTLVSLVVAVVVALLLLLLLLLLHCWWYCCVVGIYGDTYLEVLVF